jgi:hypothetical protein
MSNQCSSAQDGDTHNTAAEGYYRNTYNNLKYIFRKTLRDKDVPQCGVKITTSTVTITATTTTTNDNNNNNNNKITMFSIIRTLNIIT